MVENYDWRPLEKERVMALMDQNPEGYARLCYELGVEPEDMELYRMGAKPEHYFSELERVVNEEIKELKPRKRSVSDVKYREFHEEADKLSTNLLSDTDTKMNLLETYFPVKGYARNMTPRQIGKKFENVLNYTKRRIAEKTR